MGTQVRGRAQDKFCKWSCVRRRLAASLERLLPLGTAFFSPEAPGTSWEREDVNRPEKDGDVQCSLDNLKAVRDIISACTYEPYNEGHG